MALVATTIALALGRPLSPLGSSATARPTVFEVVDLLEGRRALLSFSASSMVSSAICL